MAEAVGRRPSFEPAGAATLRPLYAINRRHLDEMSDSTGIWQFARGTAPHRAYGYCTDDVARALMVDVMHGQTLGLGPVAGAVERDVAFIAQAFDAESGRFRNMRDAKGAWVPGSFSEDCHARALLGLGMLLAWHPEPHLAANAAALFFQALPAADAVTGLRPTAAALLACGQAIDGGFMAAGPTFEAFAARLSDSFTGHDRAWPWPENVLTYENGILPRALVCAGEKLGDAALMRRGSKTLDWLIDVQMSPSGHFSPIGNRGWWPRNGNRAQFDQQPIEAGTMVLAACDAYRVTGRTIFRRGAESAYGWFLGDNDTGLVVADVEIGGCRDGLAPDCVSDNEGAESTLMWLMALESIRRLRSR
jgi:hypothetical protein